MGFTDLILDLTLGSWAGDSYRTKKAINEASKALYEDRMRKEAEEERRHQELLQAIREGRRK